VSTSCLPDILIVGAEKAGTTSLFFYLSQHPDIQGCSVKESYLLSQHGRTDDFWAARLNRSRGLSAVTDYARLFSTRSASTLRLESCPLYLYDHEWVIGNIQRLYGEAAAQLRIVVCLRDPRQRILSSYGMKLRNGTETLPLAAAVDPATVAERMRQGWHYSYDYVGVSCYADALSAYEAAFRHVSVVDFGALGRDACGVCNGLVTSWGIRPHEFDIGTRYNVSGRPRSRLHGRAATLIYRAGRWKRMLKTLLPANRFWSRLKYAAGERLFESEQAHEATLPDEVLARLEADTKRLKHHAPWTIGRTECDP
jgi:hypothetical protein